MERHIKQQHPEHWSSKPRGGRRNHSATVPVLAPQFRSAVAAVAAAAAAAGAPQQTSLQPDGGLTNGGGGLVTVVNPNNNNNEAYHSRQSRVNVLVAYHVKKSYYYDTLGVSCLSHTKMVKFFQSESPDDPQRDESDEEEEEEGFELGDDEDEVNIDEDDDEVEIDVAGDAGEDEELVIDESGSQVCQPLSFYISVPCPLMYSDFSQLTFFGP